MRLPSPPAWLVVNADDGGLAATSDAAILAAAAEGVVTSASVVAGGPTAAAFVARARDLGLGLGLHFNLTEGRPLAPRCPTLTDGGSFPGPKGRVWVAAARSELDPEDIAREARAQWQWFEDRGVTPDHLDSHNHVHAFPCVLAGLARALGHRSLFLRAPEEPECPGELLPGLPPEALDRQGIAQAIPPTWRLTDRFAGFAFSRKPNLRAVGHLATAAPGITEWMVHPGRRPGSPFSEAEDRDRETSTLTDPNTRETLRAWGYRLTRFAEVGW